MYGPLDALFEAADAYFKGGLSTLLLALFGLVGGLFLGNHVLGMFGGLVGAVAGAVGGFLLGGWLGERHGG